MNLASTLPVLALPHPLILIPTQRVTIPVAKSIGDALLDLLDQSDSLPVVAAVPLTQPIQPDPDAILPPAATTTTTPPVLAEWGTAARVLRLVKPPTRNSRQPFLVSLHGLTRVRLLKDTKATTTGSEDALPIYEIQYPPSEREPAPSRETIDRFKGAALRLLDRLAKDSVQPARRDGYLKIASMLDDLADDRTPWMADVLVGSLQGIEYPDKLAILSTPDPSARITLAADFFLKLASISEVSKKIASAVDESLSKQQKEFFLRQQLAAIQRELSVLHRSNNTAGTGSAPFDAPNPNVNVNGNGNVAGGRTSELDDEEQHEADDLADLKRCIEAMEPGSEERKMGVREWRRLKRIPQGSVENGVIRTYLEWLTSIPWPNSVLSTAQEAGTGIKDKAFLANARAQLDKDHFGLEKIKRRLIEYLAVVRLKELNVEREGIAAQAAAAAAAEAEATSAATAALKDAAEENEKKDAKALVSYDPKANQVSTQNPTPMHNKPSAPVQPPAPPKPQPLPHLHANRNRVRGSSTSTKPPILLLVGPPGTGKTSLGQSIARALDRPFQRIALGGVRDEAEIRGHRRTYVASGPGLIVQALRKAGRSDVVIVLDEVDKVGHSNFHGDPSAALLEVLDPEQNWGFNDHYINVPIDLSQVLFICTANSLDTIAPPLLDRCEIITLSGYTYDEKIRIARRFLLPKQLVVNGLKEEHVDITEGAMLGIATRYTREAGVRGLERAIGAVVRAKAVEWAEWFEKCEGEGRDPVISKDEKRENGPYNPMVEEGDLEKILGLARYDGADEIEREREVRRGVVYGLVVTGQGEGGVLPVESILVPSSSASTGFAPQLKLTGSLGDVIKESAEIALSWVRRHAWELGITGERMQDPLRVPIPCDVHLHLPAGAQRKDGPSAGIAMVCAFVSLLTGACVNPGVAMTGEITLRGKVTPVGGIKEKVLGAHRAGVRKVILPYANRKDVEHDVPAEVKKEVELTFVRTVNEALEEAFGKGVVGWRRGLPGDSDTEGGRTGFGRGLRRGVIVESRL